MFQKSALVLLPVCAVLIGPLFCHRSAEPAVGPYGVAYATVLVAATSLALAVALGVSLLCSRVGSLVPVAYVLFLVMLAVVVIGIAEVALTWTLRGVDGFDGYRAWGHRKSLIFGFEAKPDHAWQIAGARYSTDPYGFRTHVSGDWEHQTGPRIFALGGSATFGYGLADDETWPQRLEGKLRLELPPTAASVVNAGNNGFNSLQVLLKYYLRVAPRAPTHIVFYGGHNDVWPWPMPVDGIWLTEDILYEPSIARYWASRTRESTIYARTLVFYALGTRLGLIEVADPSAMRAAVANDERTREAHADPSGENAAAAQHDIVDLDPDEIAARNAERFERNLRTLVTLVTEDGAVPILATFIQAYPKASRPNAAVRHHNEIIRRVAAEKRLLLVDLEALFDALPDERSYFFDDRYHPNRRGAEFIAHHLADALSRELARGRAARGTAAEPAAGGAGG